MRKFISFLGVIVSGLALAGLGQAAGMPLDTVPLKQMEGGYYFLGTNLHADMIQNKVSSVNYQLRGELLPWGSEIRVLRVMRNHLVFEDVARGKNYTYEFHRKTRRTVALSEHFKRLFLEDAGPLKAQVAAFSEAEKDGIYEGRVKPGMSRDAVLIAIGYPPEFVNRQELMESREWFYWVSRHRKMAVSFGRDGRVSRVNGDY